MCCFRDFLKVKGKILKALSCTDAKIIRLKIDIAVTVIHRLFLRWCGVRQNFLRCCGVQTPTMSPSKRFLTQFFLVSESVATGKSSYISNCIILVDMAPSNEPLDPASHKMLYSSLQMIILLIQFLKEQKNILPHFDWPRILTSSVDNFL